MKPTEVDRTHESWRDPMTDTRLDDIEHRASRIPVDAQTLELVCEIHRLKRLAEMFNSCAVSNGLRKIELEEALERMLETHGMHGPCKMNNCEDCKAARKKAVEALARSKA